MTPEGRVKARIKNLLKRHEAYYFMPVQQGLGAPALDFFVCYKGMFLAIEAKALGKVMTPRQELTAGAIRKAEGSTLLIDGSEESIEALESWITMVDLLTCNKQPRLS